MADPSAEGGGLTSDIPFLMITSSPTSKRELATRRLTADLAVVGGGLGGVCAAITAAREGLKVVLVQDRPVLGGNCSSEVRLWILGATSHMGNNNRWAREGGVIDEILVENTFRNREGNPYILDTIILEKVASEPNITLLLNTAVFEADKQDADTIASVRAFCSQNSTLYEIGAPLFCDASGDGILGFMAGAAFRMGAESSDEFGEKFAPSKEYGELLGHSLYFYSKDVGEPVKFTPPSYALDDITRIPRWRQFNAKEQGCKLWWIEYGGRLDTVHATEDIKWELWRVVYGVWNHIKNSGQFPEAANYTLEWVGTIPGKRESRRFEGDYLLRQQDVVEQRPHADAVAFGGWSLDLHPADGVFSEKPGCNQWHSKGVYQIPYRCLYSRNVRNLFLTGRIISATHVAFASSRVMATCAHVGQAVGMAAVLCRRESLLPRDLTVPDRMQVLQRNLLRTGQHIPGLVLRDESDLARSARIVGTSEYRLTEFPPDGPPVKLSDAWAMMLPVAAGTQLDLSVWLEVAGDSSLRVELRQSSRPDNHTPDVTIETQTHELKVGRRLVRVAFKHRFVDERYAFVCFFSDEKVSLLTSEQRVTGVLSLCHTANLAVAKAAVQTPPEDIGVDSFEFWHPKRRPEGRNIAMKLAVPIALFGVDNLVNGVARPTNQPNAWVASCDDPKPAATLSWESAQTVARIELMFDTDYDHPMESVLWKHPESVMPFCVRKVRILDVAGRELAIVENNHQTRVRIVLPEPVRTKELRIELTPPESGVPAALFEVRIYEG